jgi:hypothetical protein
MLLGLAAAGGACAAARGETPIDLSNYRADCEVRVEGYNGQLRIVWPIRPHQAGEVSLDLSGIGPLIRQVALHHGGSQPAILLRDVDPLWRLTVGSRRPAAEKPPEQKWEVFFDNPHQRPHQTFLAHFQPQSASISGQGKRAVVRIQKLQAGPFSGGIEFSFYAGCPLVRLDAVLTTSEDLRAILYDTGLVAAQPSWEHWAWLDTEGQFQQRPTTSSTPAEPLRVRHRMIAAAGPQGTLVCLPPPHQFQFPRDYSTNLGFVWAGHDEASGRTGLGIRQQKDGGGNFVPWFNAPPGVAHRMGVFYLLHEGSAREALDAALAFTHHDRFVPLPGYKTFTSHYHMAIAVRAMEEARKGVVRTTPPEYVTVFKNMGVQIVHLAEFHGDGHPKDPGPLRLPEMQAMFAQCRRWSDDELLLLPGEEGNDFLGLKLTGKHPGHWMSLFPRPVYWTMVRGPDQPFVEDIEPYGKVYHVQDRGDMIRLLKEERGLVWTAHPRIKASSWTPDIFKEEDFFLAPFWLGAAWKAMPADLSREKLGERALHVLDDMANWGLRKYLLGEVDVFTIDHTHELYGHMNINYLRLDRLPRFDEGWHEVLLALSAGRFFVTTGEVLVPQFSVGGREAGDVLPRSLAEDALLQAELRWTFPLAFAEIVSGDGRQVYRQRIDFSDTEAFGERILKVRTPLAGRHWVRLEVWDVAANGAFTQPVWIDEG